MIKEEFIIFSQNSKEKEFTKYIQGDSLTIQVNSNTEDIIDLTIEGGLTKNNYNVIYPIKLEGYITESNINKSGLYIIPLEGINYIKFINNGVIGSINVIAKVVE